MNIIDGISVQHFWKCTDSKYDLKVTDHVLNLLLNISILSLNIYFIFGINWALCISHFDKKVRILPTIAKM